jgi:hypothetical protein
MKAAHAQHARGRSGSDCEPSPLVDEVFGPPAPRAGSSVTSYFVPLAFFLLFLSYAHFFQFSNPTTLSASAKLAAPLSFSDSSTLELTAFFLEPFVDELPQPSTLRLGGVRWDFCALVLMHAPSLASRFRTLFWKFSCCYRSIYMISCPTRGFHWQIWA